MPYLHIPIHFSSIFFPPLSNVCVVVLVFFTGGGGGAFAFDKLLTILPSIRPELSMSHVAVFIWYTVRCVSMNE